MNCIYCGAKLEGNDSYSCDCRNCEKLWQEDMKNKHYPHGFVYRPELEGKEEQIMLEHWKKLKLNSNDLRQLTEGCSASMSSQWQIDRLTKIQAEIVEDINLWNRIRVDRLSTPHPSLDTSKVHLY